jgi:hypothetical protein
MSTWCNCAYLAACAVIATKVHPCKVPSRAAGAGGEIVLEACDLLNQGVYLLQDGGGYGGRSPNPYNHYPPLGIHNRHRTVGC